MKKRANCVPRSTLCRRNLLTDICLYVSYSVHRIKIFINKITSQNEKIISQFNGNGHLTIDQQQNRDKETTRDQTNRDEDLEETRKEVDRLLRMVQILEREKFELSARLGAGTIIGVGLKDTEF